MSRPKNAVLLLTCPPDWKPQRVHDLPPDILGCRFYARSLPINMAIEIARAFNKDALKPDEFKGEWCVTVRALKTHAYGSPYSRQQSPDPNSRRSRERAEGA